MTYTPQSAITRQMDRRIRSVKRMVISLIVMNILLWGFIAYRVVTNDSVTVEVVE